VVAIADFVGSTAGMVDYAAKSTANSFIIATECGIMHSISSANPEKELVLAAEELICPNMKSITLQKILNSLETQQTVITVPEDIRVKAAVALEKMIAYSS
jgi:quinolinate synthase